jgi:hypothetical protein
LVLQRKRESGLFPAKKRKRSPERSLRRFLLIKLGAAEEQLCQLLEPEGQVLALSGASLRFIKKRFGPSEKGFGQQAVHI